MRVVQVLSQVSGGPVDHAVDVATRLAERGHDSHVVGPRTRRTEAAVAAGVTWHDLHVAGKTDLSGGRAVVRGLTRLGADVVHGHDRRAGWLVRGLARRAPWRGVYTLHGVPDGLSDLVAGNVRAAPRRRRDRLLYLHGERLVTRWSRGPVVVPSHAVARYAVDHVGLPAGVVHVVPNGVDETRWSAAPAPGPAGRPVVVAWVGLVGAVKRLDLLVEAVARVADVRLVVVGDGPDAGAVRRLVADRGLTDRVELLGAQDDVRPALAGCDLLALTSAAENLPLSVLQAMASARPVLATAVGGLPELVRPGVDGWLVPAGDLDALAAALADAVRRREELPAMGERARERVLQGWTLDACVDGLLEVYA